MSGMNRIRWISAVLIATLIVGVGIYWETSSELKSPLEPLDREAKKNEDVVSWKVTPEATQYLNDIPGLPREGSTFRRLSVPGQVQFHGSSPESIPLNVQIRPVQTEVLNQLENRRSLANKFVGSPGFEQLQSFSQNKPLEYTIRTDSSGRFEIQKGPPGLYRVSSGDTQWAGQLSRPQIQKPGTVTPLELEVQRYARLQGTVVNSYGEPVSDARIRIPRSGQTIHTDSNGRFAVDSVDPARPVNRLTVEKSGYTSQSRSLSDWSPGETKNIRISLPQYGLVHVNISTEQGDPVRNGELVFQPKSLDDPPRSGTDTIRAQPNEFGQVRNISLRPGTYRFSLSHPEYEAPVKTLRVDPARDHQSALQVRARLPLRVALKGTEGRKNVDVPIPPEVQVYDENDDPLQPGFTPKNLGEGGIIEGTVHPEIHRGTITFPEELVGTKNTFRFTRADLPDVELSLDSPPRGMIPYGEGELQLQLASGVNSESVRLVELYVLEKGNGDLVLNRGGRNIGLLEESVNLPEGNFYVYTVIETEDSDYTAFGTARVRSNQSEKIQLVPRKSARVSGTIKTSNVEPEKVRVGLRFREANSSSTGSDTDVYFPAPLTTNLDEEGRFAFEQVPPRVRTTLVVQKTEDLNKASAPRILHRKNLSSLTEEEHLEIPPITIRNP